MIPIEAFPTRRRSIASTAAGRLPFAALALLVALVVPPAVSGAQTDATAEAPSGASDDLGASGDGPVEILADGTLEWLREEKVYVARGNALARRGDVTVEGDVLVAYYRETATGRTEIFRVSAEGNVQIYTSTHEAFGDKGVYDLDERIAVLTGDQLLFVTPTDEITARDSLEYYQNTRVAVARGDAVAKRAQDVLRSDLLTAQMVENDAGGLQVDRIDAYGSVVITTPTDTVFGDRGVYVTSAELATLTGDVRITRGDNQLNGARAEVDLRTGESKLFAGQATDGAQRRVRALFFPDDAGDDGDEGEETAARQ